MNEEKNEIALRAPVDPLAGNIAVEASRAVQEVQGQIVVAKKFPRSIPTVISNILEACKRKGLAESATFSYPRGGEQITGPSIRLAEELARNFQNLDYGIRELEQKDGESVVQAYCWDLETNVRQTKVFTVTHERFTKKGSYALKDPRDIYEIVANSGSRRLRACILGVIPAYIVDEAVEACEKTLADPKNFGPITDRIAKLLLSFKEYGVTKEMIEKKLSHNVDSMNTAEIVSLGKIYNSLKNEASSVKDWFEYQNSATSEAAQTKVADVNERLKNATTKPTEEA